MSQKETLVQEKERSFRKRKATSKRMQKIALKENENPRDSDPIRTERSMKESMGLKKQFSH
jgi:hypothetical protein